MPKPKTNRALLVCGMLLFLIGMALAAAYDLPLNLAVYNATFLPAIWMEAYGFCGLYLPAALWVLYVAQTPAPHGKPRGVRLLLYAVAGCGFGLLAYTGLRGLATRGIAYAALWNGAVWLVLGTGVLALLVFCRKWAVRLEFALRWATVYMVLNNLVLSAAKLIWNRTRFDDMLQAGGGFEQFTAWWQPFGQGGTSFPSGHTAAACGIFVLVLLCDVLPAFGKHRTAIWAVSWGWVAWMAVCRIIIGRHFLSDTVAAAFLMTVLFFAITKSRLYTRGLAKLPDREA